MAHKTESDVARELSEKHKHRTWVAISREDYEGEFKPGTLSSIASGKYFPADEHKRRLLGVGPKVCKLCHQKITSPKKQKLYKRLEELQPKELLWVLQHRTENF